MEGGLWLLAYLFTPEGRQDIQNRIRTDNFYPQQTGKLKLFKVRGEALIKDPIEETIEELIDDQLQECIDDNEEILIDEEARIDTLVDAEPKSDDISDEDEESTEFTEDELMNVLENNHGDKEANRDREDHQSMNQVTQNNSISPTEFTEQELLQKSSISEIDQARDFLMRQLLQKGLNKHEAKEVVGIFNDYLIAQENRLPRSIFSAQANRYNWALMRAEYRNWRYLSDIAMRLLASACSEASCERTISAQRLILASRRMKSTKRILDARLTLMRAID
jgi:hypothetical protein